MKKNIFLLLLLTLAVPVSLWAPDIDMGDFSGHEHSDADDGSGDDGQDRDTDTARGDLDTTKKPGRKSIGDRISSWFSGGSSSSGPVEMKGGSDASGIGVGESASKAAEVDAISASRGLDFTMTRKSDGSTIRIHDDGSVDVDHKTKWEFTTSKDGREMRLLEHARESLRKQWWDTTGNSDEDEANRQKIKKHFDAVNDALRDRAERVKRNAFSKHYSRGTYILDGREDFRIEGRVPHQFKDIHYPKWGQFEAKLDEGKSNEQKLQEAAQNHRYYGTRAITDGLLRRPSFVGHETAQSYNTLDDIDRLGRELVRDPNNQELENEFYGAQKEYGQQIDESIRRAGSRVDELERVKRRLEHQIKHEGVSRAGKDFNDFLEEKINEVDAKIEFEQRTPSERLDDLSTYGAQGDSASFNRTFERYARDTNNEIKRALKTKNVDELYRIQKRLVDDSEHKSMGRMYVDGNGNKMTVSDFVDMRLREVNRAIHDLRTDQERSFDGMVEHNRHLNNVNSYTSGDITEEYKSQTANERNNAIDQFVEKTNADVLTARDNELQALRSRLERQRQRLQNEPIEGGSASERDMKKYLDGKIQDVDARLNKMTESRANWRAEDSSGGLDQKRVARQQYFSGPSFGDFPTW